MQLTIQHNVIERHRGLWKIGENGNVDFLNGEPEIEVIIQALDQRIRDLLFVKMRDDKKCARDQNDENKNNEEAPFEKLHLQE